MLKSYPSLDVSSNSERVSYELLDDNTGEEIASVYYVDMPKKRRKAAFIWGVGVRGDLRGQGIGKRLMREVLDDLKLRGVHRVALTVYSDNIPAVRLYTGLGFREPEGQNPTRYTRRMTLNLI